MPRIRKVVMDGAEVTDMNGKALEISPMSLDELDEYLAENKKLRAKEPPMTVEDWTERAWNNVCKALNKPQIARGTITPENSWSIKRLRAELDIPTINKIHADFLEMSGLELPKPGENVATPTSA